MKVHGNRIYLTMPELPESKIELSPITKKQLEEEMVGKFDRLTVYAVGEGVSNPTVSPGDEVFVDPSGIRRGVILKVDGKDRISVSYFDVMHSW